MINLLAVGVTVIYDSQYSCIKSCIAITEHTAFFQVLVSYGLAPIKDHMNYVLYVIVTVKSFLYLVIKQ